MIVEKTEVDLDRHFGTLKDGREVRLYTIGSSSGLRAEISDFGGIITKLIVPDKNGNPVDVVLGFDELCGYETDSPYFGAIIGRCANRIAGGKFSIDGTNYMLDRNDGGNHHLHGGNTGFDKRLWRAARIENDSLTLTLLSPDGDQGYPGNLMVSVKYTVIKNALVIRYCGMSDEKTPFNLTNHTYFNLAGQNEDTILEHYLRIDAEEINEVTDSLALTGRRLNVSGTPFDFRVPKKIGAEIDATNEQLACAGGYDHNYILSPGATASAYCAATGISLTVRTDLPGIQFYSGNFLTGALTLKGGRKSQVRSGFCLETQFVPDAVNHPEYQSPVLMPGVPFETETRFEFSAGNHAWIKYED